MNFLFLLLYIEMESRWWLTRIPLQDIMGDAKTEFLMHYSLMWCWNSYHFFPDLLFVGGMFEAFNLCRCIIPFTIYWVFVFHLFSNWCHISSVTFSEFSFSLPVHRMQMMSYSDSPSRHHGWCKNRVSDALLIGRCLKLFIFAFAAFCCFFLLEKGCAGRIFLTTFGARICHDFFYIFCFNMPYVLISEIDSIMCYWIWCGSWVVIMSVPLG